MAKAKLIVFGSLMFSLLVVSGMALAQSGLYGSNVVTSTSNNVTTNNSGSATVDNTGTTGVSATISGLSSGTSAVVTTSSLSGPSTGVGALSTGSVYFDISVTLPAGTTAPAGATVQVCFTNSGLQSGDSLQYWTGSSWASATNVSVSGTQICGTVPLSALTGTNFAVVPAAANYTYYYIGAIIVALVVIVIVGIMMSRRRKPAAATAA